MTDSILHVNVHHRIRLTFSVVGGQWSEVDGQWLMVSVLLLCIIIMIVVIIMFIMYVGGFVIQRNYGISGFDSLCNSQFLQLQTMTLLDEN